MNHYFQRSPEFIKVITWWKIGLHRRITRSHPSIHPPGFEVGIILNISLPEKIQSWRQCPVFETVSKPRLLRGWGRGSWYEATGLISKKFALREGWRRNWSIEMAISWPVPYRRNQPLCFALFWIKNEAASRQSIFLVAVPGDVLYGIRVSAPRPRHSPSSIWFAWGFISCNSLVITGLVKSADRQSLHVRANPTMSNL